jgi:hypothetical protein
MPTLPEHQGCAASQSMIAKRVVMFLLQVLAKADPSLSPVPRMSTRTPA